MIPRLEPRHSEPLATETLCPQLHAAGVKTVTLRALTSGTMSEIKTESTLAVAREQDDEALGRMFARLRAAGGAADDGRKPDIDARVRQCGIRLTWLVAETIWMLGAERFGDLSRTERREWVEGNLEEASVPAIASEAAVFNRLVDDDEAAGND